MHHFDIKLALNCCESQILMDGRQLTGVQAFRIECGGDHASRIVLEITATVNLTGDAQVWISDAVQTQTDKADAADARADVADARADAANARADLSEAKASPDVHGATLAYIVPVSQEARNAAESADGKAGQ